uniref:Uncharacterized protein n=1 Tax=Glossina pallidipes TaxID=7398 RepID=A0A1A9ZM79_GLOPL
MAGTPHLTDGVVNHCHSLAGEEGRAHTNTTKAPGTSEPAEDVILLTPKEEPITVRAMSVVEQPRVTAEDYSQEPITLGVIKPRHPDEEMDSIEPTIGLLSEEAPHSRLEFGNNAEWVPLEEDDPLCQYLRLFEILLDAVEELGLDDFLGFDEGGKETMDVQTVQVMDKIAGQQRPDEADRLIDELIDQIRGDDTSSTSDIFDVMPSTSTLALAQSRKASNTFDIFDVMPSTSRWRWPIQKGATMPQYFRYFRRNAECAGITGGREEFKSSRQSCPAVFR